MNTQNKQEDALPGEEKNLCPNCAHLNEPDSTFCTDCGGPIGRLATVDPAETPLTQGFILRQVVDAKPTWIVLLGTWLIFTGPIALCLGIFYTTVDEFASGNIILNIVKLLASGIFAVLFVRIPLRVTNKFLVDRHNKHHTAE
jgi:hypothetical protein